MSDMKVVPSVKLCESKKCTDLNVFPVEGGRTRGNCVKYRLPLADCPKCPKDLFQVNGEKLLYAKQFLMYILIRQENKEGKDEV